MDKEEKSSNDSKLSRMEIDDEASTSLPVASTSSSTLSLEERVARAKELVAKKNELKATEEEERRKKIEIERRSLGKGFQKVKEEQGDLQMKQALEERKREKEAERLAREKVKAQIAQDRADKAKKFKAEREEEQKMKLERERKAAEEGSERDRAVAADRSKSSRIQFRLPDGRTQTNVFDSEAPLSEVYFYVMNKIQKGFEDFSLSTTLPVKKLDNEEKSATIKALELTPSATIMVLPKSSKSSSPLISSGDFMSYIWMILSPLTFIYDLFQSFLPGSSSSSNDNHLPQGSDTNQSRLNSNNRNTRPQTAYKRRSDGGQVRREGNIARLNNDMDNDDENGTYNGNSTQQM
uniref:UBX domain-containing protein 4 n=1 Tax=Lepeophtheirus salmonis TaxID=72036 RepID=A0A0K2TV38_LEPSM